jgi:rRNA processing protein Krr1/Pno1
MVTRNEKLKELKAKVERALEEMIEISCKYDEDSEELRAAEHRRALAEKELFDFCAKRKRKVA